MGKDSLIGWCHHTLNFWMGCDKVAPECAKCYIDRVLKRQGRKAFGQLYRTKTWGDAARWQEWAYERDVYLRVFTCSLSDFFHVGADQWRPEAWKIIKDTPNLIWLILTKRPELIARRLPEDWNGGYKNVWLGVSTGCRMTLNKMDSLRKIPAALRFTSMEPLLEDIVACNGCAYPQSYRPAESYADGRRHLSVDGERPAILCTSPLNFKGFGWAITGGESGSGDEYPWNPAKKDWREEFKSTGRRTMKLEWAKKIQIVAREAGLPFYFKQITAIQPGQGEDMLGPDTHQFPSAPGPWAVKEAA